MSIRWGIIGCGDVCEVKSGPGFQKARDSELVAVMRRKGALAKDFARRHGVPKWYDDAAQLINDPDVDAVYVATTPGTHCKYAKQVAAVGKPCLMEKPMARNTRECDEMIAAFEEAGRPLFVAYYRRAQDRFLKFQAAFAEIGPLQSVNYRFRQPSKRNGTTLPWRVMSAESGGGLVMDMGCHALDLIDFLLGPLGDVSGRAENRSGVGDIEDTVEVRWTHESGVTGSAVFDFNAEPPLDQMEVIGAAGSVTVPCFDPGPITLTKDGSSSENPSDQSEHVHQPFIQSVVDELLGRGNCPGTAEAARRTNQVLDTVLSDYYGDRQVDFWRQPQSWPGRPPGK
ncbi:MAG: Gfo/Idh/MocA family protein [Limisphaerales bacterium]